MCDYQRTKSGTFTRHTKPTHKRQPYKRAYFVPTLPEHTLPWWTHIKYLKNQDEGRTYNIGIAKMQADGSRVSTVVVPLGGISSLTLSI